MRQTAGTLPRALWRELAELGVLALATPEGDGGARELVAALESLGAAVFPGPLAATFLATQVLDEKERLVLDSGEAMIIEETLSSPNGERTYLTTKAPLRDELHDEAGSG